MFTSEQIRQGNQRLLELAAYVERRQRMKPKKRYDQRFTHHDCGAPACLLGHADRKWPNHPDSGHNFSLDSHRTELDNHGGYVTEWSLLFAKRGCDNAGKNWRKAVAFIREFVANRERQLGKLS